ncbi:MAG: methylmalonyl-CoA mutase family protein [Bacteroidota bacterium]
MDNLNPDLSDFKHASKSDWELAAARQLKHDDPSGLLSWSNTEGIPIAPYYDRSDLVDFEHLRDSFLGGVSHEWKLFIDISSDDEKLANDKALKGLMGGANGIIFRGSTNADLSILLQSIDTDICQISFINQSLSIPSTTAFDALHTQNVSNIVFLDHELPLVSQIKGAVKRAENHKYIFRKANEDFMLEIAALRALRFLLYKRGHQTVNIHTEIPKKGSEQDQLFLNTTAALAAVLGGSNSISCPAGLGGERIALNVGNIIREEVGLENWTDPLRGSYYLENLTHTLITKASMP